MNILVTGASGFIGQALVAALAEKGHTVLCGVRDPAAANRRPELAGCTACVAADFTRDLQVADWRVRLAGVELVINAVGIFQERGRQTYETLHHHAPVALFEACAVSGVRRVIQISALGADDQAHSRFHRSKKAADDALLQLPLSAVIVQPSLVYGSAGASARMFRQLASLPLIALPDGGRQPIQPVHRDDIVQAVVRLAESNAYAGCRVPLVGGQALTLRQYLAELRTSMQLGPARFISLPAGLIAAVSVFAGPRSQIPDHEALAMLARGNTADASMTMQLLGRPPRAPAEFIAREDAQALRLQAQLGWLAPLLRYSLALLWIVTGMLSFGVYPVEQSYALLARTGIADSLAPLFLFGAAALDVALGIAILVLRQRRLLWLIQIALILIYSIIIAWKLPEFLLHPYAPVIKNLPLLVVLWLLYEVERR